MRDRGGVIRAPKLLACGVLLVGGAISLRAAAPPPDRPAAWIESPYRNFGAPSALLGGRVLFSDEADDPALRSAVAADLARLSTTLHEKQGWRIPTADGDPLRVYVARKEAQGVRRLAARAVVDRHLVGPAIELDATGMSSTQIQHEVTRLYAFATLAAYGAPDQTFLTAAASEFLSGNGDSEDERETTRIAAAAPEVDLSSHPISIGRLYVEEFARAAGGPAALRSVFERAAESKEEVLTVLGRTYAETAGEREDGLLLRTAARLYAAYETEAAPSRLAIFDLESSGLDAATPATHAFRHRSTLLASESDAALRIQWPEQGAPGAVVVRYRDAALPPDVLFFAPGHARAVPLSGVARIDWVVSGSAFGAPLGGAVASVETIAGFPFAGLSAQAVGGPGGPRITWTTSSHDALAGWAVFREEVLPDGRIARTGPQTLPSSTQSSDSFRYAFVDAEAAAGTYYRYTIWAVTDDGLLARAFSATLRTPD